MGIRETLKDQTRAALIEAGLSLFMEQGFAKTTVDQVTMAAGVAKGTFYNYFTTKEDLLVAGVQFGQARGVGQVRATVFQLPTTVERLILASAWAVDWVRKNPEIALVWCLERMKRGLAQTNSGFDQLLTEVLAAGQASGDIRQDRPAETMTLEVEGIFLSYIAVWLHAGPSFDLASSMDEALRAYVAGARPQA